MDDGGLVSPLAIFTMAVNFTLGAGVLGLPYAMASAGIALTVGAGLYVIHREQIAARRPTREA